jgi:hypothetical protein
MAQTMTEPKPLPTAAEAMREAVAIASAHTLGLTAYERAQLWLSIAHELRDAAQQREAFTRMWSPISNYVGETATERVERLVTEKISPDPEPPAAREPVPADIERRVEALLTNVPAGNDFVTQQFTPITWAPGDRADCVHCHTPIFVNEFLAWHHKYTDQAVCAVAVQGESLSDVTLVHTVATPPYVKVG